MALSNDGSIPIDLAAISDEVTQVREHVDYEYEGGIRGLAGRLLFSKPALYLLFTARKLIARRQIGRANPKAQRV